MNESRQLATVLREDANSLTAARSVFGDVAWSARGLSKALEITYGQSCDLIRRWFHVGIIRKNPKQTGGYQKFLFTE